MNLKELIESQADKYTDGYFTKYGHIQGNPNYWFISVMQSPEALAILEEVADAACENATGCGLDPIWWQQVIKELK